MSCHTFQSSNSGLSLLVPSPSLWLNWSHFPLSYFSLSILSPSHPDHFLSLSLSLSRSLPCLSSPFLHPYLFTLLFTFPHRRRFVRLHSGCSRDSEDKEESVCPPTSPPMSKQCGLTTWKYLEAAYWHGVSHHPGSAQLPGHCCCGLCVSSSRICTACTWSPEKQAGTTTDYFFGIKTQYLKVFWVWYWL